MSKPWKHPKTGVYYYRKAVPAHLRDAMEAKGYGKWEVKFSLETHDPDEAKQKWPEADLECQRRFREAETGDKPTDFRRMARDWIKEATDTEEAPEVLLEVWSPATDDSGEWVRPPQEQLPNHFLESAFYGAEDPYCSEARQALWEVLRAMAANKHTMMDAFDGWKIDRQPTAKIDDEWHSAVERFGSGKIVERLTRADIEAFKDAEATRTVRRGEVKRELARSSVKKYVGAIKSILDYAVEREWRVGNPALGVKVRDSGNKKQTRLPYTKGQLETIFDGPVYKEGFRPKAGAGEAAYWLPILALYTGSRETELGQLRGIDVREEDGIWFLDIVDDGEGQRVKNAGSRHRVPIHQDYRDRFLAYVAKTTGPLFPNIKPDTKGTLTGNWSKWWGRYARGKLGITDSRYVFHSFRHNFKNLCREADIPEEVHDQLTGHSGGSVSRSYGGRAMSVRKLAEHLEKIKVGVDVFGAEGAD